MNDDLISREALKKAFAEYGEKAKFTQGVCQQLIDNTPTVESIISPDYVTELQNHSKELIKQLEAVKRPIGKWLFHTYMPHKPYCDKCECNSPYGKLWDFCPNCGADMKAGEEE